MTDRELRRLSRADLIDILYELRKSEDALQQENTVLRQRLADSEQRLAAAESLAEASAELTGLLTAAQDTAGQYLTELRAAKKGEDVPPAPHYTVRAAGRTRGGWWPR